MNLAAALALTITGQVALLGSISVVGSVFHTEKPIETQVASAADIEPSRPPELTETEKLNAKGWFERKPGIWGRWCTTTCCSSKVIGDRNYILLEVWAKDRDTADIYAKVNLLNKDKTVVGWTNDTLYLSKGQKGILTFSTSQEDVTGGEIVEFNVRG